MRYIELILAPIRKNPIEIGLISLAILISIISFILHNQASEPDVQSATIEEDKTSEPTLSVEVSGAVVSPDVYAVLPGTNIKEVIGRAGGLSDTADRLYVGRNYNLARLVGDQDKIYIPYVWDIQNGTFYEQKRVLEYLQPLYQTPLSGDGIGQALEPQTSSLQISINDASAQELDTLPGVGPVTAQKIVDSRPYTTVSELVTKKVVNQSTFDSMKDLIKL